MENKRKNLKKNQIVAFLVTVAIVTRKLTNWLRFMLLRLFSIFPSFYHLRLARTSFVALKNRAITLRKYSTSRVSTTPRLNEL